MVTGEGVGMTPCRKQGVCLRPEGDGQELALCEGLPGREKN